MSEMSPKSSSSTNITIFVTDDSSSNTPLSSGASEAEAEGVEGVETEAEGTDTEMEIVEVEGMETEVVEEGVMAGTG
jgi:hypothetical protein